jgi:hypothetical protein
MEKTFTLIHSIVRFIVVSALSFPGHYHELFIRGRPDLCFDIQRRKVKGLVRKATVPDNDPNFYAPPVALPPACAIHAESTTDPGWRLHASQLI